MFPYYYRKVIIYILNTILFLFLYYNPQAIFIFANQENKKILKERLPTASVKTIPLKFGKINKEFFGYGTVVPLQNKIHSYTIQYECSLTSIFVMKGQHVLKGQPLLKISATPNSYLLLKQAKNDLNAIKKKEKLIKDKLALKLTTALDLLVVQKQLKQAEQQYQNLKRRGISKEKTIKAVSNGIVYKLKGKEGEIIPEGKTILQTIQNNELAIEVGVDPANVKFLHKGQNVTAYSISHEKMGRVSGRIYMISKFIDSGTQQTIVYIILKNSSNIFLNDFYEVKFYFKSNIGFVVPKNSVLKDNKGFYIFLIKNGIAIKYYIKKGGENSKFVEIIPSKELHIGDHVVIVGNYELKDGMPVIEEDKK